MLLVVLFGLQVFTFVPAEPDVPQGQCLADGECTAITGGAKSVVVFNNGLHEGGVSVELQPTGDIQALADDLAEKINAEATLLPHQKDYGFGKPYSLYTGNGTNVTSWEQILDDSRLYVVPNGLLFMWPTIEIGHAVELHDIETPNGKPVIVRTLKHSPMVFELENLLTEEEAEAVRVAAMEVKHEGNKFQRSTTGHTGNVDPYRTSDNAFVHSESEVAMNLTKRAFHSLRMKYDMALGDGIQVLRYNASGGYRWHTDWFPEKLVYGRNHDVTRGGSNRFATVFFYLSDVEWGGQTGFPEAEGDTSELNASLAKAETMFRANSWEMQAVEKCFGKFSVKPKKARAILFYSLKPNGKGDPMSMHTGCPVLEGQKWAANLWIWNKDRESRPKEKKPISVTFTNRMKEKCLVSWVTNPRHVQGSLEPGQSMRMSTYDTDAFVFRDVNRVRVLARWTANIALGETQVVHITYGMDDLQEEDWGVGDPTDGELHLKIFNQRSYDVDVYWAGDLKTPVMELKPSHSGVIKTWDGHGFKVFKKGETKAMIKRYVATSKNGKKQKFFVD
mmetsp:Transcript_14251/g.21650  ORF Transcript_14251/g.21650 Transcript_14251/m.21650 type:complete len:561 (+) Transcript_14251:33-1715(+)